MGALVAEPTDYKKLMWALQGSGCEYDALLLEEGVRVEVLHPHLGTSTYYFDDEENLTLIVEPADLC